MAAASLMSLSHLYYTVPPAVILSVLYRPLLTRLDVYKIIALIIVSRPVAHVDQDIWTDMILDCCVVYNTLGLLLNTESHLDISSQCHYWTNPPKDTSRRSFLLCYPNL